MKFFKTVDEKLADIGFVKLEENRWHAQYGRKSMEYNYTQIVFIGHKKSGEYILQSYDADLTDQKKIGNTCVGLTAYELKLFSKKMNHMELNNRL